VTRVRSYHKIERVHVALMSSIVSARCVNLGHTCMCMCMCVGGVWGCGCVGVGACVFAAEYCGHTYRLLWAHLQATVGTSVGYCGHIYRLPWAQL